MVGTTGAGVLDGTTGVGVLAGITGAGVAFTILSGVPDGAGEAFMVPDGAGDGAGTTAGLSITIGGTTVIADHLPERTGEEDIIQEMQLVVAQEDRLAQLRRMT